MKLLEKSLITTLALLGLSAPALATDGRTAVELCLRNPKCHVSLGRGSDAIILIDDKIIYCPSAKEQCDILRKQQDNKFGRRALTPDRLPLTTFPSN